MIATRANRTQRLRLRASRRAAAVNRCAPRRLRACGFSLPEMLTATAIFMIVMAVIGSALITFQKRYQGEELNTEVTEKLRSTVELIAFDIGQSGGYAFTPRQLTASVTPSAAVQTIPLNDASGLYAGEPLRIDTAFKQELVHVQSVSASPAQITAVVMQPHAAGAAVDVSGMFATGVLATSNSNTLQLFGDTNNNGTLNYIQYGYSPATGILTRANTPVTAGAQNPSSTQLQNMLSNPGGTPVFQYTTQSCGGVPVTTAVVVTFTVQTSYRDPQTQSFKAQTASIEAMPRNALAACRMASDNLSRLILPQPPGLPMP